MDCHVQHNLVLDKNIEHPHHIQCMKHSGTIRIYQRKEFKTETEIKIEMEENAGDEDSHDDIIVEIVGKK